jgi:biopolymer transport protein ExbD
MSSKLDLMDTGDAGDPINSTINTTPLVDIMLVMLIIFLITVPVITKSVPVVLPLAENIVTETTPENIVIAVDTDCNSYWNDIPLRDSADLFERLAAVAVLVPQPEVHIRGDKEARFECVGRVMFNLQRASIQKVGFITEPPARITTRQRF